MPAVPSAHRMGPGLEPSPSCTTWEKTNRGFWERQFSGKPLIGHTNETAALLCTPCISSLPAPSRLGRIIEDWGAPDLFFAAMAHHGRPLEAYAGHDGNPELGRAARDQMRTSRRVADCWLPGGGYDPLDQLSRLLDAAERRFPAAFANGPALPGAAPFVSLFCGLLTLADWLGSDTSLFPVHRPHGPDREPVRADAVTRAVTGRGLAALATPPASFAAAFGLAGGPRGLQCIADHPSLGTVALMEAETGSGKTEAALWRWLSLRRQGAVDGLYFALPTRSAAVQTAGPGAGNARPCLWPRGGRRGTGRARLSARRRRAGAGAARV